MTILDALEQALAEHSADLSNEEVLEVTPVEKAIRNFYSRSDELTHQQEAFVFGLTVTDIENKDYWKMLLSNTEEGANARMQTVTMGAVIDAFMNETGIYTDILKSYYGVDANAANATPSYRNGNNAESKAHSPE